MISLVANRDIKTALVLVENQRLHLQAVNVFFSNEVNKISEACELIATSLIGLSTAQSVENQNKTPEAAVQPTDSSQS